MAKENFIIVSLDDVKSKEISEVLGSETCKKIINYLAENKEASQKDISDKLEIPMNTLDYNIKKLLSSGFIEKKKNFFWSTKGKKIAMYELSNKSIVISPKKSAGEKIKSIIPAFILTAAGTVAVWAFEKVANVKDTISSTATNTIYDEAYSGMMEKTVASAPSVAGGVGQTSIFLAQQPFPMWGWFLAGALLAIFILSIVNWRKL